MQAINNLKQTLHTAGYSDKEIAEIEKASKKYKRSDGMYENVIVECCLHESPIDLTFCEKYCPKHSDCDNHALFADILKVINNEE